MLKFSEYNYIKESLLIINNIETSEIILESDKNIIKAWLKKVNYNLSHGENIINYLYKFGKEFSDILIAAIKKDKQGIKDATKEVTKEEFLEFLLKFDNITLGILSVPIALISAVTGWNLDQTIEDRISTDSDRYRHIKKAIEDISKNIKTLVLPDEANIITSNVNNIKTIIDKYK